LGQFSTPIFAGVIAAVKSWINAFGANTVEIEKFELLHVGERHRTPELVSGGRKR